MSANTALASLVLVDQHQTSSPDSDGRPEEAAPSEALEAVLNQIEADANDRPEAYLRETIVPAGGE